MFVHIFLKVFSRIVFKNIKNIIFVLFENCYLNLMFSMLSIFSKKKIENQNCFRYFLEHKTIFNVLSVVSLFFQNKKTVFKNYKEIDLVLRQK